MGDQMTEQKHTPGPWNLVPPNELPWALEDCGRPGEKTLTIIAENGYGVLSIPASITDGYPKSGVAMANARLIAAAPELLEAAKEVISLLEEHGGVIVPHLLDTDENAGQRLRDAIAKAEGIK